MFFYIFTLTYIFWFFKAFGFQNELSRTSFFRFWENLTYYVDLGWLFKLFFAQLAGLPPMFIFFFKIGFFITYFSKLSITILILITINFILSTFFYLQYFKINKFSTTRNYFFDKEFILSLKTFNKQKKQTYWFVLFFLWFNFMSIFSLVFIYDFFAICNVNVY